MTEETSNTVGETVPDQRVEAGEPQLESSSVADVQPGVSANETGRGKRNEKVGIVASDKMQKTVVVRVDRLIKHPTYKRYVRRRTKFMAHNEIDGLSVGDQVRIVETRPLSAHKRWRVVEVLRKASK